MHHHNPNAEKGRGGRAVIIQYSPGNLPAPCIGHYARLLQVTTVLRSRHDQYGHIRLRDALALLHHLEVDVSFRHRQQWKVDRNS